MPTQKLIIDPGMRQGYIAPTPPPDLFSPSVPSCPRASVPSTRQLAASAAAKFAGHRYRQILTILAASPSCIFEVAQVLSSVPASPHPSVPSCPRASVPSPTVFDHQISGRFGELVTAGLIERTGQRRTKPSTGCLCDEYRLTLIGHGMLAEPSSKEHQ